VIRSQPAQARARLRVARAFLLSGLAEIWEAIGETGEPSPEQNAMIRLPSTRAIHPAREVVDTLHRGAGATAIFDDRRSRPLPHMHIALPQAQGRQAHYEIIDQSYSASRRIRRCSLFSAHGIVQ
jgi:indole-3-acetate monooxygenase